MFAALILVVILAIVTGVIVLKAIRSALSLLSMRGRKPQDAHTESIKPDRSSKKEKGKNESEEISQEKKKSPEETPDPLNEEERERLSQASQAGITESFWTEKSDVVINGKDFADACVENSALTYLEVNNRNLAEENFFGFNVIIEDDKKMTLTYRGSAIVSLTRIEKETTAVINGETVKGTQVMYRTNTFPPRYVSGMLPDDIDRMISAARAADACEGNPKLVKELMENCFTGDGNIPRLRADIVSKIQAKESVRQTQSKGKVQNSKPRQLRPSR